jgi:hypothetical protein
MEEEIRQSNTESEYNQSMCMENSTMKITSYIKMWGGDDEYLLSVSNKEQAVHICKMSNSFHST